jgi:hypothetical protein
MSGIKEVSFSSLEEEHRYYYTAVEFLRRDIREKKEEIDQRRNEFEHAVEGKEASPFEINQVM